MKIKYLINLLLIMALSLKIVAQDLTPNLKDTTITSSNESIDYESSTILKTGSVVQEFSLTTIDGQKISLSELKGKTIFLNFFTLSCPMCMKELPLIEKEIWQKHKNDKNIVILIIGREEPIEKLKAFRDKKQFTFPIASDTDRKVYSIFASKYVPRNIILDKEGKLVLTEVGYTDEKSTELFNKIEELLIP